MAKKGGDIIYSIGFDIQKQSLNQLKKSLKEIQNLTIKDMMKINNSDFDTAKTDLIAIQKQAGNVQKALRAAFNAKLNTTNVESFNKSLNESGTSIEKVYQSFSKSGAVGENAFRNLSSHVLSVNAELKQTHQVLDKFAQTFVNVAKYNLANTVFRGFTSTIQQAVGYVKSLDTSLNDIRIVTSKTADEMGRFAEQANNAAKQLGTTTVDYTNAALIYAQQGLSDKEIQARTAITLKTANVTNQSTADVSEQLTAVWNGYKVNADQAQIYIDRLAAVAATTASDLEELSKGMGKVASTAATMGVSEQQLAAQLSTIISATRQAPQSVGTALRTVYARISDIKAGIDEDGVTLGRYSSQMAQLGFNVLDMNGNLRDMGEVMEEIGGRWDDLTREQQIYLAQTMAGQRQYNNLLALFDNFEEYNEALNTAQNAAGTLQKQQDIYMDSTAAHLKQLKASVEDVYDSLIDVDSIKSITDALSGVAVFVANFIDGLGGGKALLQSLGAIGVAVFSEQIAKGINTTITNLEIANSNAREFDNALQATKDWQGIPELDEVSKSLLKDREHLLELSRMMSPEEFQGAQKLLNDITNIGNQIQTLVKQKQPLEQLIDRISGQELGTTKLENIVGKPEKIDEILNMLEKCQQEYDEFQESTESVSQSTEKFLNIFDKVGQDGIRSFFTTLRLGAKDLKEVFDEMTSNQQFSKETQKAIEEIGQLYEDLPKRFSKSVNEETFQKFKDFFDKLAEITETSGNEIKTKIEKIFKQVYNDPKIVPELQKLRGQMNAKQNDFNGEMSNKDRAVRIEEYAKAAAGLARIGSSIQQIQHLGSVWKNQDLSTGQRILQIVTNLSFSLPMLIKGIGAVGKATNLLNYQFRKSTAEAAAVITSNGAKAVSFGAIGAAATEAGFQIQFLNSVITITPLGAFITAALAAVTALGFLINKSKQARKAQIEHNESVIQEANTLQEQLSRNQELYKSIEELNQKYKEGQITRSDLKSGIEDLINQYGLEGDAADRLRNNYDNLIQTLKELKAEEAQKKYNSSKEQYEAAKQNLWSSFELQGKRGVKGSLGEDNQIDYALSFGSNRMSDEAKEILSENGFRQQDNGTIEYKVDYNLQSLLIMYPRVKKAVEDLSKTLSEQQRQSQWYKDLTQWVADSAEQMEAFDNASKDVNENQAAFIGLSKEAHGVLDFSNVTNAGEFLQQRQKLQAALEQQGEFVGDTTAKELADSYLLTEQSQLYNQYNEIGKIIDKIQEKASGIIPDKIIKNLSELDEQHLEELFKAFELSPSIFSNWDTLGNVVDNISHADFSNIKEISAMQGDAAENYAFYQSLEDQVRSGKSVSKTEFGDLAPQIQSFFTMMANGSYKMTEDAEQFYTLINNLKLEGFKNTLFQIESELNRVQLLSQKQYDYDELDNRALQNNHADFDLLKKQIEYLKDTDGATQPIINEWTAIIEKQQKSKEWLQEFPGIVKQIYDAVAKVGDQTKDLSDRTAQLKQEEEKLAHQLHDAMFPTDSDVDETAYANLTKDIQSLSQQSEELSKVLKQDREGAEELAESILRFDNAIQDVVDNYDTWLGALQSGSWQEQSQAISGLRDAYADLLDLDGQSLSNNFLTNVENLKLMKAAIDGNVEAYDQLMQLAGQDIATQIHLDTEAFKKDFDDIMELYYQGKNLQDLKIGASLDNEGFLKELSNMVNAANMTAKQATDYLASMGVDAEIIQQKTTAQDTVQYTGAEAEVTNREVTGVNPIDGSQVTYRVPTIRYKTVPADDTETKQHTAFALKVVSAHKTSGGGFKYKKSANGAGAKGQARRKAEAEKAQKAADKTAKDNTNTSTKNTKKPIEQEKDLYHDIDIEIKKINRDLERTQKIQDKLYGKQLLDNLNKQTAILEAQKRKLKEKQQLQRQDLANQQQILNSLGVTFDEYGNINDYMSILQAKQDAVNRLINEQNSLIESYNASTDKTYKEGLDKQISAYDKAVQSAQEDLKNTQAKIKDYDSLRNSMEDIVDQIEQIAQKQIEINIKKFRMQLEIRLQMGEAAKDWNQFVRNVINKTDFMKDTDFDKIFKDATKNVMDLDSFFNINGSIGTVQKLTQQLLNTRKEIEDIDKKGTSAIYGNNKAQAMADLKSDLSELMKQMQDIEDLIADIDKAYLDTIDDISKQFEKQQDDYDFINDLIQHDMDLLKLLYGDENYEAMENYYAELEKNQNNQIDALRKQIAFWKQEWQQALLAGDTNAAKQFEENYKNAIKEINSLIETSAKTISEKYSNAIDKIFDQLDKKITDGKGTDYLSDEWDLMNKNADEYLDTINAAFALQDLQNKFQKSLNNPNQLKHQQALKKVMDEQLDNLKNKQKITQYDVDRAQKMLQIEQARIALEDIRASKTSLRLKRDSQGNYSYQYVADQNGIFDAEQGLISAQNELYNFDKQRYQNNLQEMLSAWRDFQQKYKDIVTDTSLTEEERVRQLALLKEQYGEYINNKAQQNSDIRKNLTESAFNEIAAIYNIDVANYQKMTDDEKGILMGDLVPAWNSGIQQMSDKVAGQGGFIPSCQEAFEEIHEATFNYQQELDSLANTAGIDLNDVQNGVDNLIDEFTGLIEVNDDLINRMADELSAIQDLRDAAQALVYDYDSVYTAAANAVTQLYDFVQAQQQAAASAQATAQTYEDMRIRMADADWDYSNEAQAALDALASNAEANASRMQSAADRYQDALNRMQDTVSYEEPESETYYPNGSENHYRWGRGADNGVYDYNSNRVGDLRHLDNHDVLHMNINDPVGLYNRKIKRYDTGGYTGSWNSKQGRLAILDEKELVLNSEDTRNILNSVSILRSITKNIGTSLLNKIGKISTDRFSLNSASTLSDVIDQKVQISASFPAVNSKQQIEEALNDLVNLAAQRAMRRK